MKQTIPQRVDSEIVYAIRRVACAGEHVMPLQNLVQHDTVKKPAESKSKQDTGARRKAAPVLVFHALSF